MSTDPLVVDLYSRDLNGKPDIPAFIAAGRPWCGLNFKASEGLYLPNNHSPDPSRHSTWFNTCWATTKQLADARLGDDFFLFEYHYARIDEDPVAQARWNIAQVVKAGGFSRGCLPPMVDVEDAENPVNPGKAKVQAWIKAFADEVNTELGIRPLIYGNNYLHENNVDFKACGCLALEVARYASTLPASVYEGIGCPLSSLMGWQYCGDAPSPTPAGYPLYSPFSSTQVVDISAIVINDGQGFEASLQWLRDHCVPAEKCTEDPTAPTAPGELPSARVIKGG